MPRPFSNCIDCGKNCRGLRCRPCSNPHRSKWEEKGQAQRNHQLIRKYGMDFEEFEAWWIVFQGRCGICNINMIRPLKQKGQPLNTVCVDHDHETGKVRGLLCSKCNKGLGFFEDNIELMEKAIKWVKTGS